MVPGVTPLGRDDPRLIAFAGALAEHGFLVFVPELPGLRAQRVGRDDPRAVALAADALATCYAPGPGPRFAVAAISYAVAPAILAALTQPGGERMALIVGIGGYHDLTAAITYLTTGYYRPAPGAPWRYGAPDPIARWVFVLAGAHDVPDPRDRELLTEIARAKLADPAADVRGLAAGLAEGGRAMLALADNADPDRVPGLLAALPEPVRGDIEALDLKHYPLADLRADLLLIHGRDDPLIPASESRALAAAVPAGSGGRLRRRQSQPCRDPPRRHPRHAAAVAGRLPPACLARRPHRARPRALRACYDQRIRMTPAIRQATPSTRRQVDRMHRHAQEAVMVDQQRAGELAGDEQHHRGRGPQPRRGGERGEHHARRR